MSEQMNKAGASRAEAEAKGKSLGCVNTSAGFGAGAGGGFGLNKPGFGPKVHNFVQKNSTGQKTIDIPDEVANEWLKVLDDHDTMGWVVAKYSANGKALELAASGDGGLSAFKASLPPDAVAWGGVRCYAVDKRGSVECKRAKFIFVQWFPSTVGQVKKGKCAPHKGEVNEVFGGTHMDLRAESLDDIAETSLIKQLQASTGAHKPNGYEFDDGMFIEADYYGLGIGKACADGMGVKKVVPVCADDEDRKLHQKRASNMADTEQLRRIAEMDHADHEAKIERKESQTVAAESMDKEKERRVEEESKRAAPRKSGSFVPDMAEFTKTMSQKDIKTGDDAIDGAG